VGCPSSKQKGSKELIDNVISNIMQIDKETLMEKLAVELPALRAKMGSSQAELAELIGVSRQTYSMIETQKKEMGWSVYMSLILVFSSNPKTASLLDFCGAFPKELRAVLQK
jgi:DNA-binding XRE family transcriptional regulator